MSQSERRFTSIPPRGNPLARALYQRMAELRMTYAELEARSGVKKSTFKAYRTSNAPGVNSIQACLNAVNLQALPVPRLAILPEALVAELKAIGERHGIPIPVAELVMVAAARCERERLAA